MKKRAMKKWIPKGCYCDNCKWWHHVKTIKLDRSNCGLKDCKGKCYCCKIEVIKCEYMNYIDKDEDTYLWDRCKECNEHDSDKWY